MTVVGKIDSKLLFVISVPQAATKLYPEVHKQWVAPETDAVCVLGKQK